MKLFDNFYFVNVDRIKNNSFLLLLLRSEFKISSEKLKILDKSFNDRLCKNKNTTTRQYRCSVSLFLPFFFEKNNYKTMFHIRVFELLIIKYSY